MSQLPSGAESHEVNAQVLKINSRDEVLTLSSGGCNSLNLLLHQAGHVVSVDCNPAQSALLELKATAIRYAYLCCSQPFTNAHQWAAPYPSHLTQACV